MHIGNTNGNHSIARVNETRDTEIFNKIIRVKQCRACCITERVTVGYGPRLLMPTSG